MTIAATQAEKQVPNNTDYDPYLARFRENFREAAAGQHLFTTDADPDLLWSEYLGGLAPEARQHHTCHACREFVRRFGGLVKIAEDGRAYPVFWGGVDGAYGESHERVRRAVAAARVTGVHLSGEQVWGRPTTGEWHHLSVVPDRVHPRSPLKTAAQAAAEKREDYGVLCRGLADFPLDVVERALTIIESDQLYRDEKIAGPARWLRDLHLMRAAAKDHRQRDNVTWRAVAAAPPGFCHARNTMIGTLLEDLTAGLPFDAIKSRFDSKMNPLQYQRPQAPPSAGNLARAEKIVAELRSAGALERRFARLEDVQSFVWRPAVAPTARSGGAGPVFGHLTPKGVAPAATEMRIPATTMTWRKFAEEVLPGAERIELLVPSTGTMQLLALCAAVRPDSPPILQWDREDRRNNVNWYVYPGGSAPDRWNLVPGRSVAVTGITRFPHQWDPDRTYPHHMEGAVLILEGCRDLRPLGGAALFPEVLRAEYREIRSSIEAYSRVAKIQGAEDATACGLDLRKGAKWQNVTLRVTSANGKRVLDYALDRWD